MIRQTYNTPSDITGVKTTNFLQRPSANVRLGCVIDSNDLILAGCHKNISVLAAQIKQKVWKKLIFLLKTVSENSIYLQKNDIFSSLITYSNKSF
jgi:hypothetical protein